MLAYLHVKDIAIIEEIEIDFTKGFSVLTGETGAGKSIIIGSINAVLGRRISKDFIREGAEYAFIEAIFNHESEHIHNLLNDLGIEDLTDLVISRKISQSGRSIFRINGQIVNGENIRHLASYLIDIHSQLENQSLLHKKNHLALLDAYIKKDIMKHLEELKTFYDEYTAIQKDMSAGLLDPEYRKRQISFLAFEINEIESANLKADEEEQLKEEYTKLSNMSKIREAIAEVDSVLNHSHNGGIRLNLSNGLSELSHITKYDQKAENLYEQLEQVDVLLSDFSRELLDYSEDLVFDEESYHLLGKRLDAINQLKTKYGNSIDEILLFLEQKQEEYEHLLAYEKHLADNEGQLNALKAKMIKQSEIITELRQKGAKMLEKDIVKALKDINLGNIEFVVDITPKENISKLGMDYVEFLVKTNVGEKLKPLNKIASGGEMSRIMLGLKSILARHEDISAMIFDEIDTGISGRTAQKVAEKMYHISTGRQLICITHLPQIAAMADHHYVIEKLVKNNRQIVNMNRLSDDLIPKELSRLLGGAKITDAVMESAKEMKKLANLHKIK